MTLASKTILRRVEAMGIDATAAHWNLVPPDLARRLRPSIARVADGLVTMLPTSDSLRMNRVIGFGHRGRATEAAIDEIVDHYRRMKLRRFSLLLGPGPQAGTIADWLLRRGFRPKDALTLLMRDCRLVVSRDTSEVRVTRARRESAGHVVRILEACFAMPASRRRWSLAAAAAPHTEHYLAFVGATAAGVGALRVQGDLAWLGAGATLTRWRGQGVHGALIAARLRRAARRGCRWAWVETSAPARGRPDGSRRNLIRLGFEEVCTKPTFVWQER